MGTSFLTQNLLHIEWKKHIAKQTQKARFLLSREETKLPFWKELLFKKKRWQPSHYKIGAKRLIMV